MELGESKSDAGQDERNRPGREKPGPTCARALSCDGRPSMILDYVRARCGPRFRLLFGKQSIRCKSQVESLDHGLDRSGF